MVVNNDLLDRLGSHVKHEGLLLLLPPHVLVKSPLHLLGVQPLMLRESAEPRRVRVHQIHDLIVDVGVRRVLIGCVVYRCVPGVDVVGHVSLARGELRNGASVGQRHVVQVRQGGLRDPLSVRCLLAGSVQSHQLRPLLGLHPRHLPSIDS